MKKSMSEITIDLCGGRFIECQDETCRWNRECTNHRSAGDFRMDYGLRPELTGYDKEGKIAWCSTKDSELPLHEHEHGEYVAIDEVPSQLSLW